MKTRSGVTSKSGTKDIPFRRSKRSRITPLEIHSMFSILSQTPSGVFSWFHRGTQDIFFGYRKINLTKKGLLLSFEIEYMRQKKYLSVKHMILSGLLLFTVSVGYNKIFRHIKSPQNVYSRRRYNSNTQTPIVFLNGSTKKSI